MFSFNSMYTPTLVTIIYWLSLFTSFAAGVKTMFFRYSGFTADNFLFGILTIIGGVVLARLSSELIIVLFRINKNLELLVESKRKK